MYKASAGCPSCLCTTAPLKGNCEKQNTTDRLKVTSTASNLDCAHPRLGCDLSRPPIRKPPLFRVRLSTDDLENGPDATRYTDGSHFPLNLVVVRRLRGRGYGADH